MKLLEKRVALSIHGILYSGLRRDCFDDASLAVLVHAPSASGRGGGASAVCSSTAHPVDPSGIRMYRVGNTLEDVRESFLCLPLSLSLSLSPHHLFFLLLFLFSSRTICTADARANHDGIATIFDRRCEVIRTHLEACR